MYTKKETSSVKRSTHIQDPGHDEICDTFMLRDS